MRSALIGASGFVGTTLCRQMSFNDLYRSTNIESIRGHAYELVVCAGAPAVKWKANQDPDADRANLRRLMDCLAEVSAERFVLISTIDVYPRPVEVDEQAPIDPEAGEPYGRHRFALERFVTGRFPRRCILRLPGLFGAGLRKNFIYDLIRNPEALPLTDCESRFQFYDMSGLAADIERVLAADLPLVNFATEPVSAAEVAREAFARPFHNRTARGPVQYDMHTRHAAALGRIGPYLRSRQEILQAIARFAIEEGASASAAACN